MRRDFSELHSALLDLMVGVNRPSRDEALFKEAGVKLDRALLPLLEAIGRFGPIGVGELGERVGRDYTTISRQVVKLAEQGLIERRPGPIDRRVNEAVVSDEGRKILHALKIARDHLVEPVLARWSESEFSEFVRQLRRFADDVKSTVDAG